jgi:hypothetical protein
MNDDDDDCEFVCGNALETLAENNANALELLIDKMGFRPAPFDYLHVEYHYDDVCVFYWLNGREGVVRESADIFPSDALIALMRGYKR